MRRTLQVGCILFAIASMCIETENMSIYLFTLLSLWVAYKLEITND